MTKQSTGALRDRQIKIDRHVSNLGQASAKRYLDRNTKPLTYRSEILATSLFLLTTIFILIICLAL
jgi:hypothetical protein